MNIMMIETENSVEVLSDLVEINNDRVNGFTKAIQKLDDRDIDLKSTFEEMIQQSRDFNRQLNSEIERIDDEYVPDNSSTMGGTLHRAWIDLKTVFTQSDRQSILEECERGEDAIKNAYKDALLMDSDLTRRQTSLLIDQAKKIQEAHDRVRALVHQQE